jgi:methyl-accepting chemotaxis protein
MRTFRYDWYLALAGLGLPLVGTAIEAMSHLGSLAPAALWRAHLGQPLLWIMDTTPVVLGGLGRVIVRQHEDLVRRSAEVVRVEQARREGFERTARKLAGAVQALLGSVSEFTATTGAAAAGVRETTEAIEELSQDAASAALTAESVIGLAVRSERLLAHTDPAGVGAGDIASTVRGLADALDRSVKGAKEIARMAQRQEVAIEHALRAMNAISHATEETVASTRAVEREARALTELATSLQETVTG